MKILIVDDDAAKRAAVMKSIDAQLLFSLQFFEAEDAQTALETLRTEPVDAVIVDLVLPSKSGQDPHANGGRLLLDAIKRMASRPKMVIGLSAYSSTLPPNVQDTFQFSGFGILPYSPGNSDWVEPLCERLRFACPNEDDPSDHLAHSVILCALAKEAQPYRNFGEWAQIDPRTWVLKNLDRTVVLSCVGEMGAGATAAAASQLLHQHRPRYLLMSGLVATISRKAQLGDVIFSNRIWNYASGKVKGIGETWLFEPEGGSIPAPPTMELTVENALARLDGKDVTAVGLRQLPSYHFGAVASGPFVVAYDEFANRISVRDRKALGLEMEGYGLFSAVRHFSGPPVVPIFAKSVCDDASYFKDDSVQADASHGSAAVCFLLATKGLD